MRLLNRIKNVKKVYKKFSVSAKKKPRVIIKQTLVWGIVTFQPNVRVAVAVGTCPNHIKNGAKQAHDKKKSKQQQYLNIGHFIDTGTLQRGFRGIAHQFRFMPCINHQSKNPGSVPQHCPS